jgi:hypothetical protein
LVIDNLRAAVTRADWYDPEINPKVAEFCRHYGTVIMPTRPAMARHKGKVESGVKYGQNNAVKGRTFTSLAGQNLFLSDWERTVADMRIHGTTRQQVIKVFNEVEGRTELDHDSDLHDSPHGQTPCVNMNNPFSKHALSIWLQALCDNVRMRTLLLHGGFPIHL